MVRQIYCAVLGALVASPPDSGSCACALSPPQLLVCMPGCVAICGIAPGGACDVTLMGVRLATRQRRAARAEVRRDSPSASRVRVRVDASLLAACDDWRGAAPRAKADCVNMASTGLAWSWRRLLCCPARSSSAVEGISSSVAYLDEGTVFHSAPPHAAHAPHPAPPRCLAAPPYRRTTSPPSPAYRSRIPSAPTHPTHLILSPPAPGKTTGHAVAGRQPGRRGASI